MLLVFAKDTLYPGFIYISSSSSSSVSKKLHII